MTNKGKSLGIAPGSTHSSKTVLPGQRWGGGGSGSPNPMGNMISAGKLNRRVVLLNPVDTTVGTKTTRSWVPWKTLWANVRPMTAHEIYVYQQLDEQLSYTITVRYKIGITPMMRVQYKNRVFEVRSVIDPEECHEQIVMMCQELQAVGVTE